MLVYVCVSCVHVFVRLCIGVVMYVWPVSVNEQEILAGGQYWQKDPRDMWKLKNSHQGPGLDAHILRQLPSLQYL